MPRSPDGHPVAFPHVPWREPHPDPQVEAAVQDHMADVNKGMARFMAYGCECLGPECECGKCSQKPQERV